MLGAMRVDYHEYRRPALIWSLLGVAVVGLARGLSLPDRSTARSAGSRSAASRCSRPSWRSSSVIFFAAALLERRMHRINDVSYALLPIGVVTVVLAALILKEPDFGTAVGARRSS